MSGIGVGEISLLPLAALAIIPAALVAGAAFVGGYVVVQAGRGLVFCGRQVEEAIGRHAARQDAIYRQCAEYERRLVQRAVRAQAEQQHELQELLQRLAARPVAAGLPVPAALEPLPPLVVPDALAVAPPRPEAQKPYTPATLREQARELSAGLDRAQASLAALRSEEWQGLVNVNGLEQELQALSQELTPAGDIPQSSLYVLRRRLDALMAEMGYRSQEGRAKHRERQQTAAALNRAALRLKKCAASLDPSWGEALTVGQEILTTADAFFVQGNLSSAREMALAAEGYLQQLEQDGMQLRRNNLSVAIGALKDYVDGYHFSDGDEAPLALKMHIAEAEQALAAGNLDESWRAVQAAQAQAQPLAREVERRTRGAYRAASYELARSTIEEMGYRPEPMVTLPDGTAVLTAARDDGAGFEVEITHDGLLRFKAEGFGNLDCHGEGVRFFGLLREKGMNVELRSQLSLPAAAERMREALLRQGYTLVEERADPNGQYLELTASWSGEGGQIRSEVFRLNADGERVGGGPGIVPPPDQYQEWYAEYWHRYFVGTSFPERVAA